MFHASEPNAPASVRLNHYCQRSTTHWPGVWFLVFVFAARKVPAVHHGIWTVYPLNGGTNPKSESQREKARNFGNYESRLLVGADDSLFCECCAGPANHVMVHGQIGGPG